MLQPTFYGFVVFDQNKTLQYSQFNFDFDSYALNFDLIGESKDMIFRDFLQRNNFDYAKPYSVLDNLVQYFFPMTQQIIDYVNFYSFTAHFGYLGSIPASANVISNQDLLAQQFDLIYYTEEQLPRMQDFYYDDPDGTYCKYNFIFDKFSTDFNVWGPKRFVITQFITRNQMLSGVVYVSGSYGIYTPFKKYFDMSSQIIIRNYMETYGVFTACQTYYKNVNNIDWTKYIESNPDLKNLTIPEAIEQFYQYGQFELRVVPLLPVPINEIDQLKNSVCIVNGNQLNNSIGTGFAFKQTVSDDKFYIISCYHIFTDDLSVKLFFATFQYVEANALVARNITAQFRLIGKDSLNDIAMGLFDPDLPYNQVNQVDLSMIPKLLLSVDYKVKQSDSIIHIGIIESQNDIIVDTGNVINTDFTGGLLTTDINSGEYIIAKMVMGMGLSGSPQFVKDQFGNYQVVGMVQQYFKNIPTTSIALKSFILLNSVDIIIIRWGFFSIFYNNDYAQIELVNDVANVLSWLGVQGDYFNVNLNSQDAYLSTFYYTGGYIIRNIIQGYNFNDNRFIFTTQELYNLNTIQLFSPLNNTNLNTRLINSGAPVVLKKIAYFDCLADSYIEYDLGKYKNQNTLARFVNGYQPIGNFIIPGQNYFTDLKLTYPIVKLTYAYFDGSAWTDETELINPTDESWYVTYSNPSNIITKVNKFTVPPFLPIYVSRAINGIPDSANLVFASVVPTTQ